MTSSHARRPAAVVLVLVTALGTAACSGGASDSPADREAAMGEAEAGGSAATDGLVAGGSTGTTASRTGPGPVDVAQKVIATGEVVLRAADVAEARSRTRDVVERLGGEVVEDETTSDDDGEVRRSRLVLRVPNARFDDAVSGLAGVGELVSSSTDEQDVTTKVIDVAIRVRLQRRSIRRIEQLLDRAESIRDIVAIEAQLTRRQADLASLEKQQDYLADRTSLATITVTLHRFEDAVAQADASGFLGGLSAGWHGLLAVAVTAATVAGAVLPFAVVALLLGLPGWVLVRRVRRRSGRAEPAADAQSSG